MRKDEKSRRVLSIMFGFGRKSSGDGSRDYSEGKRAYDRKEYKTAFKSFLRAAEAGGHVCDERERGDLDAARLPSKTDASSSS